MHKYNIARRSRVYAPFALCSTYNFRNPHTSSRYRLRQGNQGKKSWTSGRRRSSFFESLVDPIPIPSHPYPSLPFLHHKSIPPSLPLFPSSPSSKKQYVRVVRRSHDLPIPPRFTFHVSPPPRPAPLPLFRGSRPLLACKLIR